MPKHLAVRHAENMRELGGYKTKDGRRIAHQKLIRSAGINHIDAQDKHYLSKYGIKSSIFVQLKSEILSRIRKYLKRKIFSCQFFQ